MIDFAPVRALTFDCYGTLIDWETGIGVALERHAKLRGFAAPPLEGFLAAFGRLETTVQQANPGWLYPRVLAECFTHLANSFAFPASSEDARAFGESVGEWPPFSDSGAALRRLQSRFKLVVVSNVDRASFSRSATALGVEFDAIVTAQDVGAYKPDARMFTAAIAACGALGATRDSIVHVAQSLYHDVATARSLGMKTVWVDRRAGREGGATPPSDALPDLRVETLAELAEITSRASSL